MCDWVWVDKHKKKQNSNPRPGTVSEMAPKIGQTPLKVKKTVSSKYPLWVL